MKNCDLPNEYYKKNCVFYEFVLKLTVMMNEQRS